MLDNIGGVSVELTSDEVSQLNREVAAIQIRGERLPAPVLAFSGLEAPPKK